MTIDNYNCAFPHITHSLNKSFIIPDNSVNNCLFYKAKIMAVLCFHCFQQPPLATKSLLHSALDSDRISASKLPRNSMFIHHVNDIDWLVITAFEELKTLFIEEAGAIPGCFSTTSELNLIDQAKRSYGYLPTLSGVITDTGTFQSQNNEADLDPQLACLVEGRGRVFIYHGGFVAFVDDEQTFITRMD